jgi:peroxiredoxin family protein
MRHRVTLLFVSVALTGLAATTVSSLPARAQKLVDPKTVAPEFREAAEKRHAEQVKLIECNNAAKVAKIQKRDMAQFVAECFDKPAEKP